MADTPLQKVEVLWERLKPILQDGIYTDKGTVTAGPQYFAAGINLARLQHVIESGKEPEGDGEFNPEQLLGG